MVSKKARRRPSWKAWKKQPDAFIIHFLSEEDGSHLETIRIPKMGYVGRRLIQQYGYNGVEKFLQRAMVDYANEIMETYNALQG